MDYIKLFEIFTLITGVIYLILEIKQHNSMWVLGILTSTTALFLFGYEKVYASMLLNLYYVIISFIGYYQWKKDSKRLKENLNSLNGNSEKSVIIHLNRLNVKTILISTFVLIIGTLFLSKLLNYIGGEMTILDAFVTTLSAIATFWLAKSYKEQWLLWILADAFSSYLCISQELYLLSVLYFIYCLSAIYGYIHWTKKGLYI